MHAGGPKPLIEVTTSIQPLTQSEAESVLGTTSKHRNALPDSLVSNCAPIHDYARIGCRIVATNCSLAGMLV